MIRQLLSAFKTYPDGYCELSAGARSNQYLKSFVNFYYGNKALIILTTGWLICQVLLYNDLSERPAELFVPMVYLGKMLMPAFPSQILYFSAAAIALICCLVIFFKPSNSFIRAILTFLLLWLNLLQWNFGYFSHVAHLFLLAHLFGIFMPFKFQDDPGNSKLIYSSISWYYGGLLLTYMLSGLWKCAGLLYKFFIKTEDVNWLSPEGALYNALISFRNYDLSFSGMEKYFSFPLFWQISFVFMLYIQVFALFAAWRQVWQLWLGLFIIIFHLVNELAFETAFILAPLVVLCLFFPYHLFSQKVKMNSAKVRERNFSGRRMSAFYERIYEDGSRDRFFGFWAYREKKYEESPLIGGLLYFPFLDLIIHNIFKILNNK